MSVKVEFTSPTYAEILSGCSTRGILTSRGPQPPPAPPATVRKRDHATEPHGGERVRSARGLGIRLAGRPRKAFRKALRDTHPDTGGDPKRFTAVQLAWEQVGTPEARAVYDAGRGADDGVSLRSRPRLEKGRGPLRVRTVIRVAGDANGTSSCCANGRVGVSRSTTHTTPRSCEARQREIRHTLADALAEESTARTLAALGIGYTVWHDVSTGAPELKVDHVVLGPTGLFAMLSEDFGGPVRVRRGELIGDGVDRPMHELGVRAKTLARQWRVRFTALVIVLPDDALDDPVVQLGSVRGQRPSPYDSPRSQRSYASGIAGAAVIGGNELFDVRTRIQSGVRFV